MIVAGSASPLLLSSGGYNLTNSLRFRSSASAYLNRTPASAGNRKTFTWSGWVKRGSLGASRRNMISAGTWSGGNLISAIAFDDGTADTLYVFCDIYGTGNQWQLRTTQVFRDPSAWYHIVVAIDTTQATSSNRVKIYINGTQVTAFSTATYPSLNFDNPINNNVVHQIGASTAGEYFDGYQAEINFIDGQALTPSSFGETSATTGVWIPKKYTGTYGTNGFYLPFTDVATTSGSNAGLGKDFSGNGNYWTTNNISVTSGSTYDSMTDVPTNTDTNTANYCVLNPLNKGSNTTLSNGNLNISQSASAGICLGTFQYPSTGKWYYEYTVTSGAGFLGIVTTTTSPTATYVGSTSGGYGYFSSNGQKYNNGSGSAYGATFTTNDVIGVAFDADAGTLTFYKNNVSQGTAFSSLTGTYSPAVGESNGNSGVINFGQRPFAYTPPSGFNALNTFNLPTPTIGATASTTANEYFDATTYTGTGSSLSITNSGAMQPDLVWIKIRNQAFDHTLVDAVRGTSKDLESNTTDAEQTRSTVTAFNSNGFTVGTDSQVNSNGNTFIAWQWKANGSGSTNTAGSITSTVSANTTAGFSVVTYTGNGTQPSTVGHGLGVAPKMIFVKSRSNGGTYYDWAVYNSDIGAGNAMLLNSTSGSFSKPSYWNSTTATSTVFTLGSDITVNQSSATYVAYCFAQIAGYSAFGSYTGNGSTDGPFVFTGFRPRFILIKESTPNARGWRIFDTARNPYNQTGLSLAPNSSDAEDNGSNLYNQMDILSNGFKLRAGTNSEPTNESGATYIYAAFAESPFKYANAR